MESFLCTFCRNFETLIIRRASTLLSASWLVGNVVLLQQLVELNRFFPHWFTHKDPNSTFKCCLVLGVPPASDLCCLIRLWWKVNITWSPDFCYSCWKLWMFMCNFCLHGLSQLSWGYCIHCPLLFCNILKYAWKAKCLYLWHHWMFTTLFIFFRVQLVFTDKDCDDINPINGVKGSHCQSVSPLTQSCCCTWSHTSCKKCWT